MKCCSRAARSPERTARLRASACEAPTKQTVTSATANTIRLIAFLLPSTSKA